nr:MAG TPA: hypothetical protein [Caudoviricetes sp.]
MDEAYITALFARRFGKTIPKRRAAPLTAPP